jgi:hypothetical protein
MEERKEPDELRAIARSIIAANQFLTSRRSTATAGPGTPVRWRTSSTESTGSVPDAAPRNLAVRPELALVVFDSHRTGGWNAVYLSATAAELEDVDDGIGIFSARSQEKGFGAWTRDRVLPPAKHRLYRAIALEHFVLDPHDERIPIRFVD